MELIIPENIKSLDEIKIFSSTDIRLIKIIADYLENEGNVNTKFIKHNLENFYNEYYGRNTSLLRQPLLRLVELGLLTCEYNYKTKGHSYIYRADEKLMKIAECFIGVRLHSNHDLVKYKVLFAIVKAFQEGSLIKAGSIQDMCPDMTACNIRNFIVKLRKEHHIYNYTKCYYLPTKEGLKVIKAFVKAKEIMEQE